MTTPNDLVWDSVYKGCLSVGCDELISKNAAINALQKYKNGQFTKASKLVSESIVEAKKLRVKKKKL